LLEAAESLELVDRRDDQHFALGSLGAALLGNPGVLMMIEHHSAFYADLTDPVALLRGEKQQTALGDYWAYARSSEPKKLAAEDVARYSDLMAASQALIAEQVLSSYPLHRHRRLLDIGGGAGAFAAAAMDGFPELQARVFDLPPVCELASKRFNESGFSDRSGVVSGDFLNDPIPSGDDLVSLIRVLHDHNDDAVLGLLKKLRRVMPTEAVLLIAEPMLGTRGAEPVTAAYFGFYLMAMGQGRPRGVAELRAMLSAAGFGRIKEHSTSAPLLARTLTARPV